MLLARRAGGAAASGGGTIAAILTQQGASPTTGSLRFTGGFPLPPTGTYAMSPADVTAKKFSVWIGGVEQSIHAEALRGAHYNGNVIGIRYDFDYTAASTADVVAEVRIGTARVASDISRRTIQKAQFDARRWLLATDTTFLCSTWLTAQPLVPYASWNAQEQAWLKGMMDTALTGLAENSTAETSFYDAPRHITALWCCTGDVNYLRRAMVKLGATLGTYFPTTGTYTPAIVGIMDTESLSIGIDVVDGQASEPRSVFERSCEIGYLITGWSYPWAAVNNMANAASRASSAWTFTFAADENRNIRFNLWVLRWRLASSRIDGTYRYANTDYAARQDSYASELPGWLTALDSNKFDASRGAYRENLRGLNPGQNAQTKVTDNTINNCFIPANSNGVFPTFQVSVINDVLMDYYHTVHADSRIPGWVKTNVDIVLANAALLPNDHYYENNGTGTGKYATRYMMYDTANTVNATDGGPTGSGSKNDPFDICLHIKAISFCAANYPSDTSNGKTYAEWRDLLMLPKQMGGLSWNYKYIGETFNAMSAPYYRVTGNPGGPSAIREPAVYTNQPT